MNVNRMNDNMILASLRESEAKIKETKTIPEGYIEVQLSTQGKLFAPKVLHVRNFKAGEVMALSLTSEADLPLRLSEILNDAIYEDVDVLKFHEKEVEELMIYIFSTFYKNRLEGVEFPLNEEDIEVIKSRDNGETMLADIRNKVYVPRTDFTITDAVSTYDLPEKFKSTVTIRDKETGFYVTFSYLRYGDRLVVKNWLDNMYLEQTMRFRHIRDIYQYNLDPVNKGKEQPIDPNEDIEYRKFVSERLQTLTDVSRIISVVNYNGRDVSNMPLSEKYELLSKDARIDFGMVSRASEIQDKYKFGIQPEIDLLNPITGQMCKRRFSFRIPDIIQTLQLPSTDRYDDDDEYEDGNFGG